MTVIRAVMLSRPRDYIISSVAATLPHLIHSSAIAACTQSQVPIIYQPSSLRSSSLSPIGSDRRGTLRTIASTAAPISKHFPRPDVVTGAAVYKHTSRRHSVAHSPFSLRPPPQYSTMAMKNTAEDVKIEFNAKGMPFRQLGSSGLRVPVFSLGGWLTLGGTVVGDPVKEIIKIAYENGINMFDTAEAYAKGKSEIEMGRVIKELGLRRTDLIITTKIFWGPRDGPNDKGLSRKHIIEGTRECLQRLQLDYVDVLFAHRYDVTVPMEEVVRAFHWIIEQGYAYYWATSEWSARDLEEAIQIADKYGLHKPVAEQCQHNMLHRERPEKEYAPLYKKYRIGTTVWSALASGLLTGKYNNGVPEGSRFDLNKDFFKNTLQSLTEEEGLAKIEKVKKLTALAEKKLGCSPAHLALAWVAKSPNTSTVILGASKPEQVIDNLKAIEVIPKLTPEVMEEIEGILGNKPDPYLTYGRPPLDAFGRDPIY
ncbi:Aldo/keto reductase [Heliocybe sulcata]|uniref:Aldo/keto reductase n=1 Tax=Heliocybe sulcata TaxID=5364 RepID=A0A5C3MJL9_9AGAM|nr:Aldo/keto reductase [Heliocybe sulcata]